MEDESGVKGCPEFGYGIVRDERAIRESIHGRNKVRVGIEEKICFHVAKVLCLALIERPFLCAQVSKLSRVNKYCLLTLGTSANDSALGPKRRNCDNLSELRGNEACCEPIPTTKV